MNEETQKFLEKHKITQGEVFDAQGKSISELKEWMKLQNILFAYNTNECPSGHTIRARSGHCIECNTATIAFAKRSVETGNVYLAGSISKEFIKIGMSTEQLDKRIGKLNSKRVGNTDDWVVIKSVKCDFANQHELAIHALMRKYKVDGEKYGDIESKELFRCSFEKANSVLKEYFEINNITIIESKMYLYNAENCKSSA